MNSTHLMYSLSTRLTRSVDSILYGIHDVLHRSSSSICGFNLFMNSFYNHRVILYGFIFDGLISFMHSARRLAFSWTHLFYGLIPSVDSFVDSFHYFYWRATLVSQHGNHFNGLDNEASNIPISQFANLPISTLWTIPHKCHHHHHHLEYRRSVAWGVWSSLRAP